MKVILTLNPNPPFNLRRIHPAYGSNIYPPWSPDIEDAVIADVIRRNKEAGYIPCENEAERVQCEERYRILRDKYPDLPPLVLPPIGIHHICAEEDLPGGSISEENDYFFDAWEWSD